ncbi:hypothetical protein G6F46_011580 [Rhizopus delemar]|uniref:Uncharacterized protein n=1 Tax=Rhizopus delemar (strain RA 99-880 / ATCC MYA-4621 / FGSC 9543 / NRRL 43880) TaxID=246409 RepID=I1BYC7_RHIO9|nr:hypothetical protein RO3G_05912 [Rhizopus delemar RA 99-880]KAG1489694.1 hypothetical protein G6F54_011253 [Rhizopus delemar]KAG1499397.1 hypothetical protein G6F53_011529 [Rhizopus delemar]KAG1541227.1 hypothetical protein G6F49_011936 [Rhizopus delemar]KAG1578898.1 hypothetical protein G6F48_011571 [Rhizopus delemar]|eukprot:EIE81207.1 hypothetical protein RO3G_05912 [Rhizopus delemar RA 99-880]
MTTTGQNVLATISNQSVNPGFRPRLIEFYGYEGEDFRHFQEILESYLAISNTNNDSRKLAILKSQLRRAAKVYYERVILVENPDVDYEQAMELLKKHYITPELIQSYEIEFNDMCQGTQEHPQIFLSRLREAADLANISNEAVIESRFKAGLLKEIKLFCIQSSSRTFKEWVNHAEGWWNAHRPRKIAMVDNPFIPRNIHNALIYQDDHIYTNQNAYTKHNIELVDVDESHGHIIPVNDASTNVKSEAFTTNVITGPHQLSTMEVVGRAGYNQQYTQSMNKNNACQTSQQDLLNLIQQTIRNELKQQPQYQPQSSNRPYYRNRMANDYSHTGNPDYNQGYNDDYPRHNRYNNQNGYHNYRSRNNYDNGYGRSDYNNLYREPQNNQPNPPHYKQTNNNHYNNQPFQNNLQNRQQQNHQSKN